MKFSKWLIITNILTVCLTLAPIASANIIGPVDNFEDGTTQGWLVGLLGAPHPAPPVNFSNGGPLGVDDNYLQLTSVGGSGAGNRLTVINVGQWTGDYTSAGITGIGMDLNNLGATNLSIQLYLENPIGGPPTDSAITSAIPLLAGSGWTHVEFAVDPLSLIKLTGNVDTLLTNVTSLRIFHSLDPVFPGPPVVALLGVDNITADGTNGNVVPEPYTLILIGLGLAGFFAQEKIIGMRAKA